MEIKIQIEKGLSEENVINTLVYQEDSDSAIGEAISYSPESGIVICKINENVIEIENPD